MRLLILLAAALLVLLPAAAHAQGAQVSSAVELARQADRLQPGEWVWAPSISPSGPVTIYVDLGRQIATVYRNGVRIGVSTVSSGKPGHATPTGVFTILQKDADHRSTIYDNAPMPYMERLTWGGVALHAGGLPGYPESHGCIHLPLEFARLLFDITETGGLVIVAGAAGDMLSAGAAGVLAPPDPDAAASPDPVLSSGEAFRWTPQAQPAGPVSIVLSRASQLIVVLRNGVEIGRARAVLPETDFATHVLTMTQDGRWTYVAVPGHVEEDGRTLDPGIAARVQMPETFRRDVRAILAPGATVLVTSAPIDDSTTGRTLVVADASDTSGPASD